MLLEVDRAGARNGRACVEVGLTEGQRLSFEQSDSRALSTLKIDTTKIVDGTPGALVLKPMTEEK